MAFARTCVTADATALTLTRLRPPPRSLPRPQPPRRPPPNAIAPESHVQSELHEAIKVLEENCTTTTLNLHPTMIPVLLSLAIVELLSGRKVIQYNNVDCNHNTPNISKGYKIMNNLLNNPLNNSIENEQTLGGDQQFFAINWDKVC